MSPGNDLESVESGVVAELERSIVRVHGMLAGWKRQLAMTGPSKHVTHLISGYG